MINKDKFNNGYWYSVILVILMVLSAIMPATGNAQTLVDSEYSRFISQTLSEVIEAGKAPGMIAAIISSEGVIGISSAGERKAGSGIAFTTNDMVHLGSCTKAMTCAMIATLVAENKMTWDMKLTDAIFELKEYIHPDYENTTLWQLLTHHAGIPNDPIDWAAYADMDIKERRFSILKDNIKSAAAYTDRKFHYSNFGFVVAAIMAEQITGLSWETLMRKRVFEPLGMTTAGFGDPVKHKSIDQPWGHKRSWFGNKWKPSRDYYGEVISPAGRVYCSAEDWAKFITLWLTDENPVLERSYLDKLIKPDGDNFYAGGWGVAEQEWAKGITFNHAGSNEIWYATVIVAPNLDRAYVVATNSCDFGSTPDVCVEIANKMILMEQKNRED